MMMRILIIIILLGHLDVQSRSTLEIQSATNQTEIQGETNQPEIQSTSNQLQQHACRTDEKEENTNKQYRTFTNKRPDQLWADAIVPWSFVETSDVFSSVSVHTDQNVGLSKDDVETVKSAMKQIESKTCIRFNLTKPVKGKPWLFITRDASASNLICQQDYIADNLSQRDIADLGNIYHLLDTSEGCFSGSYAFYGQRKPQILVISAHSLSAKYQEHIGHIVHELLHTLGVGHTQKRQDASENIEIQWKNIQNTTSTHYQYTPCFEQNDTRCDTHCLKINDKSCSRYNDYGTKYDCMSIMHYRDRVFSTGGKTMIAKKQEGCDLSSTNRELTNSDISLLNEMYCANKVDGSWAKWSEFSSCSNEKDGISVCKRKKVRSCEDPAPTNGGNQCNGESDMFENCSPDQTDPMNNINCVLTGGWSMWSEASRCSSSCHGTRTRTCNNPKPFNAKECEGEASETSNCNGGDCSPGTFKSPNYPENYPVNEDVPFHLEVDPGSRIKLTFTSFDLEDDPDCKFDYVKVTDSDGTTELAKLCGSSIPSIIESSGNKLSVVFYSDYSVTKKGFLGTWSKVSSICTGGDCGFGTIKSTNYPDNYPNYEDVPFYLEVDPGSRIKLTFTSFDLEDGPDCKFDYVKVTESDGTTELAKLCGSSIPSVIKSSGNKLTVVFYSDHSVAKKGFLATWSKVAGV